MQELRLALQELVQEHAISSKKWRFGKNRYFTDYTAVKAPDTSLLSEHKQQCLRELTHKICTDYQADTIHEITHSYAWRIAENNEYIPLSTQVLASPAGLTKKLRNWASKEEVSDHI